METQPKWFLTSKTIIGVLVTIAPTLLPLFGVSFGLEDGALFSTFGDALVQFLGAALALWGRFAAKSGVTVLPK